MYFKMSRRLDKDDLFRQAQASGRIPDILRDLCGVPNDVIEAAASRKRREFPCPKCGGKTRFRVIDVERGSVYCSHCCRDKSEGSGDFFGAVKWFNDCSFSEALKTVDEYLNGGASGAYASRPSAPAPASGSGITVVVKRLDEYPDAPDDDVSSLPGQKRKPGNAAVSAAAPAKSRLTPPEKTRLSSQAPANTPPKKTVYRYRDENGVERWRVVRYDWPGCVDETTGKPKKTFNVGRVVDKEFVKGLNGEKVPPYNLPELLDKTRRIVCVVEGEKCAVALRCLFKQVGFDKFAVATTLPNGAKSAQRWSEYVDLLRDKERVFVFADNDAPGRKAARTIAEILTDAEIGATVKVVDFRAFQRSGTNESAPEKYDVANFVEDLRDQAENVDEEERKRLYSNAFDELTREASPNVFDAREYLNGGDDAANAPESETPSETFAPGTFSGTLAGSPPPNAVLPLHRQEGNATGANAANALETDDEIDPQTEREIDEAAPDFPLDALPFFIGDYCAAVAKKRNVPPEAVAIAALATVGAAVGSRVVLDVPELERRGIIPNVSAFIVGQSGAGKSDVLHDATFPVRERQQKRNVEREEARQEIGRRNAGKKRGEPLEEVPFFPKYRVVDATPEALTRDLADNANDGALHGLLYVVDEGARFFNFGAYGSNAGAKDVSIFLELLNGSTPDVSRKGAPEIAAKRPVALSILGGIQPGAIANALQKDPSILAQGLPGRFLWANCPVGSTITDLTPFPEDVKAFYRTIFDKIELLPETRFTLAPEAFSVYMEFEEESDAAIQRRKKRGADAALAYWRKSRKTALQVASLFQVANWTACEPAATLQGVRLSGQTDDGGAASGFEEFDAYGGTDEGETLPASEFDEAINPVIDAETMRRAVAFARWSCESFETMLRIFNRAAQESGRLVAPESPLFERVLKAIQKLNDAGTKATGNQIRGAANLKGKARGGGKKNVDKILKTLAKQGKVEGDDRRGFSITDKGRAAFDPDANDETETDELETDAFETLENGKAA